jgi:predicted amidophosphoribosyltransferase
MWRRVLDLLFPAQCAGCNALGSGLCRHCVPLSAAPIVLRFGSLAVVAYGAYEGVLRSAILALKDGRRDVGEALGERLAPLIDCSTHLVPVPTSPRRRRARGVDGVALVAATAARLAGASMSEVLVQRARDAQRGRTRGERLAAQNRFGCRARSTVGPSITLIDDVCTTGATLADCARAIQAAGGTVQGAVVVAATKGGSKWESGRRV